jgi:hypothetical protein
LSKKRNIIIFVEKKMDNLSNEKELLERQIAIINIYTIFHLTKSEKIKIQKS